MGGPARKPQISGIKSYDVGVRIAARGRDEDHGRFRDTGLRQNIPVKGQIVRLHRESPTAKRNDLPPFAVHWSSLRVTYAGPFRLPDFVTLGKTMS